MEIINESARSLSYRLFLTFPGENPFYQIFGQGNRTFREGEADRDFTGTWSQNSGEYQVRTPQTLIDLDRGYGVEKDVEVTAVHRDELVYRHLPVSTPPFCSDILSIGPLVMSSQLTPYEELGGAHSVGHVGRVLNDERYNAVLREEQIIYDVVGVAAHVLKESDCGFHG